MSLRVGVLASGRGTALDGVLQAIAAGTLDARIALVVYDRATSEVGPRLDAKGVPTLYLSPQGKTREAYDAEATAALVAAGAEVILMAGYMRIVSESFIDAWQGRLLNIHPSLLPAFAGMMDRAVHEAVLASGAKETGCTVHGVTAQVDAGPIVLQHRCAVLPNDTVDTLRARVQSLEQQAFVDVLQSWRKS